MRLKYSDDDGHVFILNTVIKIGKDLYYIDHDKNKIEGRGIHVKNVNGYHYATDKLYVDVNNTPIGVKLYEDYEEGYVYLLNKESFELVKTDLNFNLIKILDDIDTKDFVARTYKTKHDFIEEPWNVWKEKAINDKTSSLLNDEEIL